MLAQETIERKMNEGTLQDNIDSVSQSDILKEIIPYSKNIC